jgi:hypothetical protein
VNVVNSTTVTAVTPPHAAGAVDLVLTSPNGTATHTNAYTYMTTAVGQPAYGGIVACLNGGLNNLIATTQDIENTLWVEQIMNSSDLPKSGTDGQANTAKMVEIYGVANYAAAVCSDYEVDSQGNFIVCMRTGIRSVGFELSIGVLLFLVQTPLTRALDLHGLRISIMAVRLQTTSVMSGLYVVSVLLHLINTKLNLCKINIGHTV